ncbi:MAG: SAM-dependent methyltransferase [Micromonosporaceae bacterium]
MASDRDNDDWFAPIPSGSEPAKIDTSVAHIARVYDYWLGGKDNYAADRQGAEEVIAAYPGIRTTVRAQRAFLGRAVRYLTVEAGVRQFLDIGTGLPSANNTHEVAQEAAPESRVVYVDNDPIVLAHARALLEGSPEGASAYIDADLRDTGKILEAAAATLDFAKPVGVIMIGILHCLPDDDDPAGIVAQVVDAVPSGSYLAIAHPAKDIHSGQTTNAAARLNRLMSGRITLRTRAEVCGFFDGMDMVEPGVVQMHRWRPDSSVAVDDYETSGWAGIGQKP